MLSLLCVFAKWHGMPWVLPTSDNVRQFLSGKYLAVPGPFNVVAVHTQNISYVLLLNGRLAHSHSINGWKNKRLQLFDRNIVLIRKCDKHMFSECM